jgi:thioesterase III
VRRHFADFYVKVWRHFVKTINLGSVKKFNYELVIREGHLDSYGHVNHGAYFQLFEEARWEFATAAGFGLETVRETGKGLIIVGAQAKFHREIRLRERIRIESYLKSYVRTIATVHQEMINPQGKVACTAEFTSVYFDMSTRKMIPAPSALLEFLGFSETF